MQLSQHVHSMCASVCRLKATCSIGKPLGKLCGWALDLYVHVCVCFVLWVTAIMNGQGFFNSRGIPQHCLVIVMQRRMQSLQGLGKTSAYLSQRWMADRYFSRAPGGSRGKINFLMQRKDLQILLFFPLTWTSIKIIYRYQEKANQVFLFGETTF